MRKNMLTRKRTKYIVKIGSRKKATRKGESAMCNILKLRGKMTELGIRQEDLAKVIGIDRSTMSRRMKTGEDFTIGEVKLVVNALHLTIDETLDIFLPSQSQKCD